MKNLKNILIFLAVAYFLYALINGEVKQKNSSAQFCKEQCNYNVENKTWDLDLQSVFDEAGVTSRIDTKKSFPEKELNQCIDYCAKDLQRELKFQTQ